MQCMLCLKENPASHCELKLKNKILNKNNLQPVIQSNILSVWKLLLGVRSAVYLLFLKKK